MSRRPVRQIQDALCGLLVALTVACNDGDEACACGIGCWDCVDVGANASDDERPDYSGDAVLQLATGYWEGTLPDGPDGAPLHLQVTIGAADGPVGYRAARAVDDGAACDIPPDAVDRCAGLHVPTQVDIIADPAAFSVVLSELTVYGRTLISAGDDPEARHYEGFPSARWEVFQDGLEYNLTLLFSPDARLWMSFVDDGNPVPFVDIGERR